MTASPDLHTLRTDVHGQGDPSTWIARWLWPARPGQRLLDVACGAGRHVRLALDRGWSVWGVDRNPDALRMLPADCHAQQLDLEGPTWPLGDACFDAVVVTQYLYRPHFDALLRAVAPGGWLLYETFALGNERHGKPSNPDFLLRPGELLERVSGTLQVVAYEHGETRVPRPAVMQRIAAWRAPDGALSHPLESEV